MWYQDFIFNPVQERLTREDTDGGTGHHSSLQCSDQEEGACKATSAFADFEFCIQEQGDAILIPHEWGHVRDRSLQKQSIGRVA